MSAQWPLIRDKLVQHLPTLPGWAAVVIFPGVPTTSDAPARYLTVGYVPDPSGGGNYSSSQDPDGYQRRETGVIRSQLVCTGGNVDPQGLLTAAFALADAFEDWVRADRTLAGALAPVSQLDFTVEIDSVPTAAALVLSLQYLTVT